MSFFTKPVSQITFEDLNDLLQAKATEGLRLEFKSTVPDKDEMTKKLTAMANSYGGRLIVGAQEDKNTWQLAGLRGVPAQPSFDAQVSAWCAQWTYPPVQCSVSPPIGVPGGDHVVYVIDVPQSLEAPHFLNGRQGVYVRVGETGKRVEEQLAEFDEIMQLSNRRAELKARRRDLLAEAEALARKHQDDIGYGRAELPRIDMFAAPLFPARQLLEEAELMRLLHHSRVPWRNRSFPASGGRHCTQPGALLVLGAADGESISQLTTWGSVFHSRNVPAPDDGNSVHLVSALAHAGIFVIHALQVWQCLVFEGPVAINITLVNSAGRPVRWSHSANEPLPSTAPSPSPLRFEEILQHPEATAQLELIDRIIDRMLFALNQSGVDGRNSVSPREARQLMEKYAQVTLG